ncbi:RHOMBOID-like protein 6 [Picochlorum sp. SENEW3]|nr:RHOMBOID-like protein 6 [Picochlorum sp. SENEW3]
METTFPQVAPVDQSTGILRTKSEKLSPKSTNTDGTGMEKRPQPLQVENLQRTSSSTLASEASQSIKAGHLDSFVSSPSMRGSMDVKGPESGQFVVLPAGKYGQMSPRRLTPRSSRRGGSSTSGQTVTAKVDRKTPSPRKGCTPIRELDRMAIEAKAPPRFICPISGRVMKDPVILATGTTCDRCALEKRLAKGQKRCPVTNKTLRVPISMTPNSELMMAITAWARKNAPWMMDPSGSFILTEETNRYDFQGKDTQYVSTPGAAGPARTPPSRMNSNGWTYTNGSKVRPGRIDVNATPGTLEAGNAPWYVRRGIASPRSSRQISRSRSSRGGSPQKSKKKLAPVEWYSIGFLTLMTIVYVAMFILSLSFSNWEMAPMSENPWYGATRDGLVQSGALVLPLMNSPGNEWWRLISSIFLPAGLIHLALCLLFLWVFGAYARTAMPFPQATVAALFLLSSLVGSLASANLNADYIACGAFSGILSLLGVIVASQTLEWPRRKLLNLKEWYLVTLILLIVLGGLIVLSLFPLVDVWFSIGGAISGVCLAYIVILFPKVQTSANEKRTKWLSIQIGSGVVLVAILIAAIVGCALPTKVGESANFLKSASCVELSSSMNCVPFGYLESGCGMTWSKDVDSVVVACPISDPGSSASYTYYPTANVTFDQIGDLDITEVQCQKKCDVRNDPIDVISVPPVVNPEELQPINETEGAVEEQTAAVAPSPEQVVSIVPEITNDVAPQADPPISSAIVEPQNTADVPSTKPAGVSVQLGIAPSKQEVPRAAAPVELPKIETPPQTAVKPFTTTEPAPAPVELPIVPQAQGAQPPNPLNIIG